jgi:transposase
LQRSKKIPNALLSRYRGLWQIEAAFRVNKNDLRMRPIFHWKENRIKSHLLICFMAYTLVANVQHRLKAKNIFLSFEKVRDELLHCEASILYDKRSRKRFQLPSNATELQKEIYRAFNLILPEKITRLRA